jgi:hypothetical protein
VPMVRPPGRDESMPAAWQYFVTSRHGILQSRCLRSSPKPLGVSGRKRGPFWKSRDLRRAAIVARLVFSAGPGVSRIHDGESRRLIEVVRKDVGR